jgi:hypothetical protein
VAGLASTSHVDDHHACVLTCSIVVMLQVRVYIDGQLAGFYPISYTMYTVSVVQNALI